jgi:hypothetical protein
MDLNSGGGIQSGESIYREAWGVSTYHSVSQASSTSWRVSLEGGAVRIPHASPPPASLPPCCDQVEPLRRRRRTRRRRKALVGVVIVSVVIGGVVSSRRSIVILSPLLPREGGSRRLRFLFTYCQGMYDETSVMVMSSPLPIPWGGHSLSL